MNAVVQTFAQPEEIARLMENARRASEMLKALSHEARLMILCLLADGEMSVGSLLAQVDLSQSALSQHLAKMREEGLLATRRESQSIFYRIGDPAALKLIGTLANIFCPPELKKEPK